MKAGLRFFRLLDKNDIVHIVAAPSLYCAWRVAYDAGYTYDSLFEIEKSSVEALGLPTNEKGVLK